MFTLVASFACACGARTELDVLELDAASFDSSVPDVHDAGAPDVHDAAVDSAPDVSPPLPLCDYGTLVADALGATTRWNNGAPLPAGHYRVTYVDGCMKYSSSQAWTVNAYANGPDTLYLVTSGNTVIAPVPGTVGFYPNQGGFTSFDACVNANLASDAPYEFDFAGGELGLWLADGPYTDNVPGPNGRNPTYRLSSCP